jgi:hypothetical protein
MTLALLLSAVLPLVFGELPQDRVDGEAAPLRQEKERLRARAPLTDAQKALYASPAAPPGKARESYALAVVPVEFSDRKLGEPELVKKLVAGLTDYYAGASGGRFKLAAKVCDRVALGSERDRVERKELEKAVAGLPACDGVAFVAAGGLVARNAPLWPHRGVLKSGEREIDYMLVPEEAPVAILAHEFMHLLGFADKYDDEKASVADACILGTGYSVRNPPPPCVECRIRLGWSVAATVDPAPAPVSIVLDADLSRALRVKLTPDGDETLLLELREKLLVWHIGGGRKVELIGRFPTETSDRLTPLSQPAFRGRSVGARSVCLTDIRLQDGKAWFQVSLEAPLTPLEEWRREHVGKRLGD